LIVNNSVKYEEFNSRENNSREPPFTEIYNMFYEWQTNKIIFIEQQQIFVPSRSAISSFIEIPTSLSNIAFKYDRLLSTHADIYKPN
jgi:hypothetical protein